MKKETILSNLIKVTADEGKVLAEEDRTAVYGKEVYVPSATPDGRFIEVTEEVAEEIRREIEERQSLSLTR